MWEGKLNASQIIKSVYSKPYRQTKMDINIYLSIYRGERNSNIKLGMMVAKLLLRERHYNARFAAFITSVDVDWLLMLWGKARILLNSPQLSANGADWDFYYWKEKENLKSVIWVNMWHIASLLFCYQLIQEVWLVWYEPSIQKINHL